MIRNIFLGCIAIFLVTLVAMALVQQGILTGFTPPPNWMEIMPWVTAVILIIVFLGLLVFVKDFQKTGFSLLTTILLVAALVWMLGFDNVTAGFRNLGVQFANLTGGGATLGGSDFRTISNGFVRLPKGGSDTFYVQGSVRIQNFEDYCLNISPEEAFSISWSGDVRIIYLVPKSGEKELVSVESKPISRCKSS